MKKLIISILLLCTISCEKEIENQLYPLSNNLCGIWYGYGYTCYNNTIGEFEDIPIEIILIEQNNNFIRATKLVGDNCISSGQVTWEGYINNDSININLYAGSFGTATTTWESLILIENPNFLVMPNFDVEFVRATNEQINNEIQDIYFKAHNTYLDIDLEGICKPQN